MNELNLMSGQRRKDLARELGSIGLRRRKLNRRDSYHGNSGEKEFNNEREVNRVR